MDAADSPATHRVCSSCGERPGGGLHCQSCGSNLLLRRRLPTRDSWENRRGKRGVTAAGAAAPTLRYSARDLGGKQRGQSRRLRRGKLMLVLTLNELLEPAEEVVALFSAEESLSRPCWLVLTSHRLMSIPDRPAILTSVDTRKPQAHRLSVLDGVRSRRRTIALRSRFNFSTGEIEYQYWMRGTSDARELMRLVGKVLARQPSPPPAANGRPPAR